MPSIRCPVCELTGNAGSVPEAERWASTHDQLRHGGHPTALITRRTWGWARSRRAGTADRTVTGTA